MKVHELIAFLQTQPAELDVAYKCFSEQVILDVEDIEVKELCLPRADGWIQNKRPDMPAQKFLVFPGN